jgi:hypothetical protein
LLASFSAPRVIKLLPALLPCEPPDRKLKYRGQARIAVLPASHSPPVYQTRRGIRNRPRAAEHGDLHGVDGAAARRAGRGAPARL